MRFLRRLFIEGVSPLVESEWLWWLGRGYGDRFEKRVNFMCSPVHATGYENCTEKDGQREVLDVFLGHGGDEDEDEDEIFVTMLWWCLLVALVIYCIKRLEVMGRIWLYF